MSSIQYNKHGAEYYVGISPGQARPMADAGVFAPQSQVAQPKKDNSPARRSRVVQQWQSDAENGIATTLIGGLVAVVDLADLPIVSKRHWYIHKSGYNTYAATGKGNLMHRMIAGAVRGDGQKVDHRDCDGLNCRRKNLRITDQQGNRANGRHHAPTQSNPFKGVFRRTGQSKFTAQICKTIDGKKTRFHLGQFDGAEAAARAYDVKALELFGEFARLNFPLFLSTSKNADNTTASLPYQPHVSAQWGKNPKTHQVNNL